jgi:hypothetical protein
MLSIWSRVAATLSRSIAGSNLQKLTLTNVALAAESLDPAVQNFSTVVAVAQAANIVIDLALGSYQVITLTTNAVHTINIPTNVTVNRRVLTIAINNASGGAAGAATFTGGAGGYRLNGAWVQAATANLGSVTFRFDATVSLWREIARNAADQLIA